MRNVSRSVRARSISCSYRTVPRRKRGWPLANGSASAATSATASTRADTALAPAPAVARTLQHLPAGPASWRIPAGLTRWLLAATLPSRQPMAERCNACHAQILGRLHFRARGTASVAAAARAGRPPLAGMRVAPLLSVVSALLALRAGSGDPVAGATEAVAQAQGPVSQELSALPRSEVFLCPKCGAVVARGVHYMGGTPEARFLKAAMAEPSLGAAGTVLRFSNPMTNDEHDVVRFTEAEGA